ncbi:Putative succinate dehydrogenase/fumarate reductase type B, transmembrane subunit [Septoria linicola]|uniref:Succinate dehydrogenase/fumarate reductase type B, transmembrane subunit n=1 Tax=Septoria linicola TaxID=215465 RepID=A0A9Q9AN54_9PEZI|nr:putative succinate dehydrogenase/fumarate reductase type B, transmembrane subunit [Septoria linicola]USW51189.1 Putative succinate dehydrogenase/fumarate reductase type B, transmembrane subunit [Septoria linicola]
MLAQRIATNSLRRLAVQPNALRLAAPAAVAMGLHTSQKRVAAAAPISPVEARDQILAKQRLNRPVAPHLAIYRPQITWYLSALNRITGCAVSGVFYAYGALYLVAPYLGWHVETAVLAASFAAWPVLLQVAAKFTVAWPFLFHSFNGVRHLVWDTASMITNSKVKQTGWFVLGLTTLSSLALAFI